MRFFIKTYGCQMNVNDSEKMRHVLEQEGFIRAATETDAEVIIINSCAVREKPQEKIFSYIGRLPKKSKIVVAGCVAQMEKEEIFKRCPQVNAVMGTQQFQRIAEILTEINIARKPVLATGFSAKWNEIIPASTCRENRTSAFLSIMEGCNNFCSYCVVPFTRGREKHRPFARIAHEAEILVQEGYKEIILLGQNVNSWRDTYEGMNFPGLLQYLARRLPVRWLRFITSYPGYFDKQIIRVVQENPSIARHIHFPVQSGSTRILQRMKRNYSRSQYLRIVERFRSSVPEMKFSSDFIVGFPGETEHDFQLTLSLLERVQFESIFSFVYSLRPLTKAGALPNKPDLEVAKCRLQELQVRQERIQRSNNRMLIGREVDVLIVQRNEKRPGEVIGRSESYRVVNFPSRSPIGEFTKVRVREVGPHSLRGEEVPV